MVVVAWILLIVFGLFAINGWLKFWLGGIQWVQFFFVFFATIVSALCAGYLFGDLTL